MHVSLCSFDQPQIVKRKGGGVENTNVKCKNTLILYITKIVAMFFYHL